MEGTSNQNVQLVEMVFRQTNLTSIIEMPDNGQDDTLLSVEGMRKSKLVTYIKGDL